MSRLSALALAVVLLAWSSKANTVDICAYLDNVDLADDLSSELSISSIPNLYGDISQCLCVSGISDFIGENPAAALAVDKTSMPRVIDAMAEIIDSAYGREDCSYPDHSQATCTQNHVCGFTCKRGYELRGNECVCSRSACPSGVVARRRSVDLQMTMGIRMCPFGQEACGGYSGPDSYECIDTKMTLDSCGGCLFPVPGRKAAGTDCSAIFGAENVRCINGKCVVMSCMAGWSVEADRQSCTPGPL